MNPDFKIAAICTTYFPASHADVIVSRWLEPRPSDQAWGWGNRTRIASLYVAQFPDGPIPERAKKESPADSFNPAQDLARQKSRQFNVPIYPTLRDALTLGGESLAVDAILLIAEHGRYPFNELGQQLYPRKEFFDAILAVYRESGRVAPIFLDKHLSWNADWAQEMFDAAAELGVPFMAGSSISYSMQLKPPMPAGAPIREGVALFYVGPETYGFHSLEAMQSFVEQRPGGEAGIGAITTYRDEGVWAAMEQGAWSAQLFDAALAASPTARPGDVRANCKPSPAYDRYGSPVAYVFEHLDGLRTTHVMLEGHIKDFALAIQDESRQIYANHWETGGVESFYAHFATLDSKIEEFFLSGQPASPLARTLLTTKMIATAMQALNTPGQRIETPQLEIAYSRL